MLNWVRRLLAGNHSSAPEGVAVERDALGRVISATTTLKQSPSGRKTPLPPEAQVSPELAVDLNAASDWLRKQNIAAAQRWGIGCETNYSFDQDTGRLTLCFDSQPDLVLDSQLLGSFVPADRTFMWGWHNASISPELKVAAERALEEGRRREEPSLTTPEQVASFDNLTQLVAFAANLSGCDGVFRAMTNGSTSVFVGYRLPETSPSLSPPDPAFAEAAARLTERHDRDQLAQDALWNGARPDDLDLLDRIIAGKTENYLRDWAPANDDWRPGSAQWPSDHDRTRDLAHFQATHPDGGLLDVRMIDNIRNLVYRVEQADGEPKITDQLIYWGEGFIWPAGNAA